MSKSEKKTVRTSVRTTSVCEDGSVKVGCTPKTDPKKLNKFLKLRKTPKPLDAVIICVSSRALFDMREGNEIREKNGLEAYIKDMIENENVPLNPGAAFDFIKEELFNTKEKSFQVGKYTVVVISWFEKFDFVFDLCIYLCRKH